MRSTLLRRTAAVMAGFVVATGLTGVGAPVSADTGGVTSQAAVPVAAACEDGTKQVQLLYVRSPAGADRYAEMAPKIETMSAEINSAVQRSALRTGGSRKIRYVGNTDCSPRIDNVVLSSTTNIMDYDSVRKDLSSRGYNSADRKYLIFLQTTAFCGLASGGTLTAGPSWSMVGAGCWEWNAAGHELLHALGAVSPNAPHGTPGGHCWDDADIMCYDDDDKPGTYPLQELCPKSSEQDLVDCNNDDYFNTDPPAGTWLANNPNANVARSPFLSSSAMAPVYTGSKTITTARAGATAYVTKYQLPTGEWTAKAKIVTNTSSPFFSAVLAVRTPNGVRYVPPSGVQRGSAAHITVEHNDSIEFKLCEGNAAAKSGCTATWW
ncbi:hypothetical protein SAMN05216553_104306 [Lentzea fradiae]|uniref:Metallo-peptidase family M12B Reprolysin-like n=1 Tax=Lentzea fradiae TaxID=200378 RepID=A0A1G7Q7E4_9PSEU|nr:hypothetical protein [Lentzea fradiae]SDF94436.1 hypothetical protein SAMN05216553_104306 [Lentzea fradiae]